ncbi:bifunctional 3'-5' exonuclease/DNA polymerase [Herbiconiux daphne]|uniref:DNA-directed DNA polymerase n=1 Tax=Herbiconiux daphne TaxID=2970914 RepID=A0ABT2H6P7_9MICO|nr:bifunctional 3'-5' exonuclease/DNA polymerase [Herbiconiux daphne]MCS5735640.1 bifunctional 3'-5' exonuclease/DNA polymerase [Herbiconiux daphne]
MSPFIVVSAAGSGRVHLIRTDDAGAPVPADVSEAAAPVGADPAITTVDAADLARTVAALESERPRWVWDDTSRWYPPLLAAGVRVERCVDLRLSHAILRHSTLTESSELAKSAPNAFTSVAQAGVPAPALPPSPSARQQHSTLFDLDVDLDPDDRADSLGTPPTGIDSRAASDDDRSATKAITPTPTPASSTPTPTPTTTTAGTPAPTTPPAPKPATAENPVLREFRRQREAIRTATDPSRIALLIAAESAGSLVAVEMQHAGIPWNADHHDRLLADLLGPRPVAPGIRPAHLEELLASIRTALDDPLANPDSPVELVKSLRRAGLDVTSTRSWELKSIVHPVIEPLLEYKKLSRLLTANGWNWVDTWVRDGRFHPNYIPGGVVTGRWASEGGGALQLPKQVRSAVIADPGWKLVVADAAQLEPRILAALAGDRAMAAAGRGRDLYDGIVASGAVDTRAHAKVGMLGAMYGGTTGESGRMLPRLARAYPAAVKFVEDAARAGEAGAVVTTRLGRTSPRPSDAWLDVQDAAGADGATDAARNRARSAARSWGRFTRNFVVQGTAAEWALCWISSVRRRLWHLTPPAPGTPLEQRPHLAFFLHDEVMVHTPAHLADAVAEELRSAALEAGRLIFGDAPVEFPVTVAIVGSYDQAK